MRIKSYIINYISYSQLKGLQSAKGPPPPLRLDVSSHTEAANECVSYVTTHSRI